MSGYSMKSKVRYLRGRVDVNYYDDDSSYDRPLVQVAENYPETLQHYAPQIFDNDLPAIDRVAVLNGENICKNNCNLDDGYVLCGDGGECLLGWYGTDVAGGDGVFENMQTLAVEYAWERELDHVLISGDSLRGEYPAEYVLVLYDIDGGGKIVTLDPAWVTQNENGFPVIRGVEETRTACIEAKGRADFMRNDIVLSFESTLVKRMELRIKKWSVGNTVAKINYFSSEKIERYLGDKLKSINIVEEKTGDTDKLSYGISSNALTFEFLNENKRFYYNKDYALLRKNRRVYPYIRCGEGEMSKPLGVFYSDEWKIADGDPFVTCKAYDVLYPLRDLTINYGMQMGGTTSGLPISPYKDQTVTQIFERVFMLINENRRKNGLFSEIEYELKLGDFAQKRIPIVLIEEKSAWDVLQDLANLTCSYIYCNREGTVVVETDNFTRPSISSRSASEFVKIEPSNSFSYSLPVLSRTVVNSVDTEYYDLVEETDESKKSKNIEVKDFTIADNLINAVVSLEDVCVISSINVPTAMIRFIKLNNATSTSVTLQFEKAESLVVVEKFDIEIKCSHIYKLSKNSSMRQANTISKYGLQEFKYSAENLLLNPDNKFCKEFSSDDRLDYRDIADKILEKYKLGAGYVDAEWTGDYMLTLGDTFIAESLYDEKDNPEYYECMSSEISYDTKFRQKTKGREIELSDSG